jgi:DNA-binding IclR family transcriptional regulator
MIDIIVNEKDLSFNRLEKEIYDYGCQIAREILKSVLEAMDKRLAEERDKSKYRHRGGRDTSIKTLMGEVEFSRVIYESKDDEGRKSFIYLLDELLGFDTIGLISTNLAEKIVENASITSYRNAADNITELTGQSISHGGVWNVVQALGQKVKESETELAKAAEKNQLCGEKEVPVLFEEADGVYIAQPFLDKLRVMVDETSNLMVLDGYEVANIAQSESTKLLKMFTQLGAKAPLYCTGGGKAILAYKPVSFQDLILSKISLQRYTDNTITTIEDLRKEFRLIKKQGYAIDNEEREEGIICVASPIFDCYGEVVAAISISGPSYRIKEKDLSNIISSVVLTAKEISANLGYAEK